MAQKITNKEIKIGTVLKAFHIEDDAPFELNKFYIASDVDNESYENQINIEIDNHIGYSYFRSEIENYFEIIDSIESIEDLEHKALILKETFEQLKIMSESAEDEISYEALINETIAFLIQDEVYQGDEVELRFICDNMDITMVERCSCCGKFLMPDDEVYGDDLNDEASLCDHCSVFDEGRDMYIKSVRQDVIEKITGYKFSPHLGNIGSTVEEFNYWLNSNKLPFSYSDNTSTENFMTFINECTEFSTCDSCKLIEKSSELKWVTSGDFVNDENVAIKFALATLNVDALCQVCIDAIINRTKLNLHEIVQRIKENKMVYRVGDLVVLENVNFDEKKISNKTYIDYIVSINENKQTYKLKEYADVEFTEDDFFDIANEAYVSEYTKFIASQHPDLSEDVDQWSITKDEGFPEIEAAFGEFGFKDDFIEYLKSNDLPFERLLTPKFKIGDTFTIHFAYYNKDEFTTHTISDIDKSFNEADEIVYWSNDYVYITESELEKQKNLIIDEDEALKDSILVFIFSDYVPTYSELINAGKIKSNWQLSEEYENYDYSLILEKVNERLVEFKAHLKALENVKSKKQATKMYGVRKTVEYGTPIELVCELQELFHIYANGVKNPDAELLLLQDCRRNEDYSSIVILLQSDIKYDELSKYLISTLKKEHHDEVNLLIEAIKQAKSDNHETLCVYDC